MLDTSGSMRGKPIEAVNTGLRVMISSLRQGPHTLETVSISILTFDVDAKVVVPLTALEDVVVPQITTPKSGPTHLGRAQGDWAPFLFVMTDAKPSDTQVYLKQCPRIRVLGFVSIIGCVAGPKAYKADLKPLCNHFVALDTMDSAGFNSFFKWVTATISGGNKTMGLESGGTSLPPPPPEIQVVF